MIPFIDLTRQHAALRGELNAALMRVVDSSHFVLGGEGRALERDLASLCGVRWGLGVASGTDALRLALMAVGVGPGDEVITPAFSFVASATTIGMAGAKPVFVDIDPVTYAMDVEAAARAITARTRAIMPVHLYGHPAPMDRIVELARAHRLAVVEDAAQAVGGAWAERPLGAWGDGGMVLTDRQDVAERVAKLRHHGDSGRYQHEELGFCSRLDELQAAALRVKLARLPAWT